MKYFYLILLLIFSFNIEAAYKINQTYASCNPIPDIRQDLYLKTFLTSAEAIESINQANWSSSKCDNYGFESISQNYSSFRINYGGNRNRFDLTVSGSVGCDFNECKSIASQQ
jgi:hypothetical protein